MAVKGFSSRSELKNLQDNVKKANASAGFFKRAARWFRTVHRLTLDRRLRREISRLEKERVREKTALLEKRRFYERLFRRKLKTAASPAFLEKHTHTEAPNIDIPAAHSLPVAEKRMPSPPPPLVAHPTASIPVEETVTIPPAPIVPPPPISTPPPSLDDLMSRSSEPSLVPAPPKQKPPHSFKQPRFHFSFFSRSLQHKLAEEREKELAWQSRNAVEKRFWQPYNGLKPNLIKDQGTVFFNWQEHLLILTLSLVMCCLAIGLVYVGLLVWQKERLDNNRAMVLNESVIDTEIAKSEQEIKDISLFNDKLSLVSALLDNHAYWTNFLSFLEDNTLKDVYYEKFSGNLGGEYTIPSRARSLEAISLQLEVLKANKKVKSVSYDTSQAKSNGSDVRFNLGMSIDPSLFTK